LVIDDPKGFTFESYPQEYLLLSEVELEQLMKTQAIRFLQDHPGLFLYLSWDRLIRLWRLYPHLTFVPVRYALIMIASYGLLVPFILYALFTYARHNWRSHSIFYLVVGYYSLICSAVVSYTRYRLTLQSVLLIFAAAGIFKAYQIFFQNHHQINSGKT